VRVFVPPREAHTAALIARVDEILTELEALG
jgi:hypothetical protein